MVSHKGVLVISLDFEKYWGVRDRWTINQYHANLQGTKRGVTAILDAFKEYDIRATWATVGFLFFRGMEELERNIPDVLPHYANIKLSPYHYIRANENLETHYHFAPEDIERIQAYSGQEIGTHTFSHYYCLEKGQTIHAFQADLASARNAAREKNINVTSLVFPKNQYNPDYLSVIRASGITCYRGTEKGWLYEAKDDKDKKTLKKTLRWLDSYINLSGYHTYNIEELSKSLPLCIPASRFLRPYSTASLETLHFNRIVKAMTHAAKYGELYHIWWHPHNFGNNTVRNITFLKKVLRHYQRLHAEYGMRSMNMKQFSMFVQKTYG